MARKPGDFPFWVKWTAATALVLAVVNILLFLVLISRFAPVGLTLKEVAAGVGALVSTFTGAWLAFRFARLRSEQEREDKEVAAGNAALFTLVEFWNAQTQYQKEIVAPYREREDAWLNLPAGGRFAEVPLHLDRDGLSFLYGIPGAASVWQKAALEERRYYLVSGVINERHELVVMRVWPRIAQAGVGMNDQISEQEMEAILGTDLVQQLRVTANAIIKNIDENVLSSLAAFSDLRQILKDAYPDSRFIDLQVL